ncbi:MAG: lipase maturation factor family protein [Gluconacetobacter diazotrophicus]|nr:lipase maturation factor family protein [Gluconacetobacter diazotrophicus]
MPDEPPAPSSSYWLTRFVLLRLLGVVYAVAFLVAANQLLPLIGSDGLTPVGLFLDRVRQAVGSDFAGFLRLPSVFWLGHSDAALLTVSWVGFALSIVVVAGFANSLLMAILWALYMSIVHVGQDWYGYGWESQLLETGFLAIFLCPLLDARPFPRRAPPRVVVWLFLWLIFRVMLGAGLIKLRGDAGWRDLSILSYFFETQPMPNPLSRWFHFLPKGTLAAGVVWNHVAELAAPLLVLWPQRRVRVVGGAIIVLFQFSIILGGNLSFLNWLTVVPALACFDDLAWQRLLPAALTRRAQAAAGRAVPSRPQTVAAWVVAALVALLSIQPTVNLFSARQIMNTSYDPLDLVNTYGAFGSVGKERPNVVFEGTDADDPQADDAAWKSYPYKGLPVDLRQRPPQIAPYHLRLDWQMWFAAMSGPEEYPWTLHLVAKLLRNDPGALGLFAANPFPDRPPRYVRAVLYTYKFAPPGNPDGAWWTRTREGLWLPPLAADNPELNAFLEQSGWKTTSP